MYTDFEECTAREMSQYEDDADRLIEHEIGDCDDPYCQICFEDEGEDEDEGDDFEEEYEDGEEFDDDDDDSCDEQGPTMGID